MKSVLVTCLTAFVMFCILAVGLFVGSRWDRIERFMAQVERMGAPEAPPAAREEMGPSLPAPRRRRKPAPEAAPVALVQAEDDEELLDLDEPVVAQAGVAATNPIPTLAPALLGAFTAKSIRITGVTEGSGTASVDWTIPDSVTRPIPLLSRDFTVRYEVTYVADKGVIELAVVDPANKIVKKFSTDANGVGSIALTPSDLDKLKPSSTLSIAVAEGSADGKVADGAKKSAQRLHLPSDSLPLAPAITQFKSGRYAPWTRIEDAKSPVAAYLGKGGTYVRIAGEMARPGTSLSYVLIDHPSAGSRKVTPARIHPLGVIPQSNEAGTWDFEILLPREISGGPFDLMLLAERSGEHNYSNASNLFPLKITPIDLETLQPAITAIGDTTEIKERVRLGSGEFAITAKPVPTGDDFQLLVFVDDSAAPVNDPVKITRSNEGFQTNVKIVGEGLHKLRAAFARGGDVGALSDPVEVLIRTRGPKVTAVIPPNFGTAPGVQKLRIEFDRLDPLDKEAAETEENYRLVPSKGTGVFDRGIGTEIIPKEAAYDENENSVTLKFHENTIAPDIYQLVIIGTVPPEGAKAKPKNGIRDRFKNFLEGVEGKPGTDFKLALSKPSDEAQEAARKPQFVVYPEYTKPRKVPNGFNPSDHVETRVVRLYYYRDAHRVAQIINRDVKSHNRAGAEMKRQLADKSRQEAETATDERRAAERAAVRAAQESREAERNLVQEQRALAQARQKDAVAARNVTQAQDALAQVRAAEPDQNAKPPMPRTPDEKQALSEQLTKELDGAQRIQLATASDVQSAEDRVNEASKTLQGKRDAEVKKTEESADRTAKEDRAREEQFRREVAAAHEDPDTFAAGVPESDDPVQQVSVSVIGEAVIQLRGPLKGVNIIRTMINEIDQPVAQVRVSVHTVQVNGEHGDRMEKVVGRMQKYIDHSRFLTMQSAEMLRRAVVEVAALKAEAAFAADGSQELRDQKYLHSFFGKDFIDELQDLDSEFLKSGNKLLSLHAMDSTSLSSALFLLALAKNSTRQEILQLFQYLVSCELPLAECNYFLEGGGKKAYGCCGKFKPFSQNARFTSLTGHFNANVALDDTMTPVQREFIKLAQIFKSRLVTELELAERVKERALIEERASGGQFDREAAFAKERDALKAYDEAMKIRMVATEAVRAAVEQLVAASEGLFQDSSFTSRLNRVKGIAGARHETRESAAVNANIPIETSLDGREFRFWVTGSGRNRKITFTDPASRVTSPQEDDLRQSWRDAFERVFAMHEKTQQVMEGVRFRQPDNQRLLINERRYLDELKEDLTTDPDNAPYKFNNLLILTIGAKHYAHLKESALREVRKLQDDANTLVQELSKPDADVSKAAAEWKRLAAEIENFVADKTRLSSIIEPLQDVRKRFNDLISADARVKVAQKIAADAYVPLDHKKLLDMLIDETQDKFIELLEGTRAHTANIDNYIKRITTSLDDDFNTQFYFPAFREVRTASRLWDVNFGQIETTSILSNNRAFAKVSPQATMEFDLPKRDILINEAFNSTKALFDDYGALLNDPTFLALAKLNSGQPTSSPAASTGGNSPVRNVLPGLPSQTDERILGQQGPGNKQFGSALEALIPDPAIYKFETGTGFEIRPVIQPDGQAVVFHFNYLYRTNVREPVRADEKHLGRVKEHFIDDDVQLSNFELREVSRYMVALKASRTSRGVPLLEDVPGLGFLFRPLPQAESSLQENLVMAQATIFPTLFDLMGLRWAPAVADLDALRLWNDDFVIRGRKRDISNRVYDVSSSKVDEFMRIPQMERRSDLYRSQETIPSVHPNGYSGRGLNLRDSHLREGFDPLEASPESEFAPGSDPEGAHPERGPRLNSPARPGQAPDDDPPQPMGARRRNRGRIQQTVAEWSPPPGPAAGTAREPRRLPPQILIDGARPIPVPEQQTERASRPRVVLPPTDRAGRKPPLKNLQVFSPFRKSEGRGR